MSKPADLARMSSAELAEKARALRSQFFAQRLQHAQRQLAKTSDLRATRRELARVLTLAARPARAGGAS